MQRNNSILGWLGASALLLATACAHENPSGLQTGQNQDLTDVYGTGSRIVSLTVSPETAVGTRADVTGISSGSKVDVLYFDLYEFKDPEDVDEVIIDSEITAEAIVKKQAINVTAFPVNIKLAVEEGKSYRIALWAQHKDESENGPFSFEDLTKVKVNYTGAKNNDEFRDAFCASKFFEAGKNTKIEVTLHRPFAQLNVGTTGADYNNYMAGDIYPHKTIRYSKMVVTGVANVIDVANDKITADSQDDEDIVAEFEFAALPAFYQLDNVDLSNYVAASEIRDGETGKTALDNGFTKEEYLKVKLNDNPNITKISWTKNDVENSVTATDGFFGYKTAYPTVKTMASDIQVKDENDGNVQVSTGKPLYLTETFRYMSMAYVLVETANTENDGKYNGWPSSEGDSNDKYETTTLGSVAVYFAENSNDGREYFTIHNVPVHRNWRTNLLGGLADPEDPSKDPTDPDDPSSLFSNVNVVVNLCPYYFGEFKGQYAPGMNPEEDDNYTGLWAEVFPNGDDSNYHKKSENDETSGSQND